MDETIAGHLSRTTHRRKLTRPWIIRSCVKFSRPSSEPEKRWRPAWTAIQILTWLVIRSPTEARYSCSVPTFPVYKRVFAVWTNPPKTLTAGWSWIVHDRYSKRIICFIRSILIIITIIITVDSRSTCRQNKGPKLVRPSCLPFPTSRKMRRVKCWRQQPFLSRHRSPFHSSSMRPQGDALNLFSLTSSAAGPAEVLEGSMALTVVSPYQPTRWLQTTLTKLFNRWTNRHSISHSTIVKVTWSVYPYWRTFACYRFNCPIKKEIIRHFVCVSNYKNFCRLRHPSHRKRIYLFSCLNCAVGPTTTAASSSRKRALRSVSFHSRCLSLHCRVFRSLHLLLVLRI